MVNGGTDMFMVPTKIDVQQISSYAQKMTDQNYVPKTRLIESATRILTVKMAMGLV